MFHQEKMVMEMLSMWVLTSHKYQHMGRVIKNVQKRIRISVNNLMLIRTKLNHPKYNYNLKMLTIHQKISKIQAMEIKLIRRNKNDYKIRTWKKQNLSIGKSLKSSPIITPLFLHQIQLIIHHYFPKLNH